MKDLWNDLARRVRAAQLADDAEVPFGFTEAVLRQLNAVRRQRPNLFDEWVAVLRPAVGLAFATALLCFLLQHRVDRDSPSDSVTQTEALIQLAVLNE